MKLQVIFILLIFLEISGIIQLAVAPNKYAYPYLTLIFIGIVILEKIYNRYFYKKSPKSNNMKTKLSNLGKKVKSGILVDTDDCPICMDKMDKICTLSITNCDHVFHNNCLNKWRINKNCCPLCRTHINMERELPKSKSGSNIFNYQFYKNSIDNLKGFLDEVFDDENALIYNYGVDSSFFLDTDDNISSL